MEMSNKSPASVVELSSCGQLCTRGQIKTFGQLSKVKGQEDNSQRHLHFLILSFEC